MITQIPNWQEKSPEEILAHLLESQWHPSGRVVTLGVLREALSPESYFIVRQSLEAATVPQGDSIEARAIAADMSDAFAALRTVGISLSTTDRQAAIDQLAFRGGWSYELRNQVKALGGSMVPRWESLGYQNKPTIESIQVELDELARTERIKSFKFRFDSILNQIGTAEQSQAITSLRLIADELEA